MTKQRCKWRKERQTEGETHTRPELGWTWKQCCQFLLQLLELFIRVKSTCWLLVCFSPVVTPQTPLPFSVYLCIYSISSPVWGVWLFKAWFQIRSLSCFKESYFTFLSSLRLEIYSSQEFWQLSLRVLSPLREEKWFKVAFFNRFGSFSHRTVCSGQNQLKQTKIQQRKSREDIHIVHWPHLYWNIFPKLFFD